MVMEFTLGQTAADMKDFTSLTRNMALASINGATAADTKASGTTASSTAKANIFYPMVKNALVSGKMESVNNG